ncbi:hypothetical protein ACH4CE_23450 [Streptomyces gelaticus]|uniref:hypothetical protein n=1 Tax=Streptomyces gelaticus TaxID=285446 RepID=UPI0037BD703F
MVLITLSALWVLRTRCGHSLDLCLLVSLLAVVFLATGPLIATSVTQDRLATARDGLIRIEQQAHDHRDLAGSQQAVTDMSTRVRARLAAQGWQSGVYYGALAAGALIVLLPAVGIGRHLNADYWRTG